MAAQIWPFLQRCGGAMNSDSALLDKHAQVGFGWVECKNLVGSRARFSEGESNQRRCGWVTR